MSDIITIKANGWKVANALRVAAEQYDTDARNARRHIPLADAPQPVARLAHQFERQARDARDWAQQCEDQA